MEIKSVITNTRHSKDFIFEADALNAGLGAILEQDGKAVAYISSCLSKSEMTYLITEKEVLAALWAMKSFGTC